MADQVVRFDGWGEDKKGNPSQAHFGVNFAFAEAMAKKYPEVVKEESNDELVIDTPALLDMIWTAVAEKYGIDKDSLPSRRGGTATLEKQLSSEKAVEKALAILATKGFKITKE